MKNEEIIFYKCKQKSHKKLTIKKMKCECKNKNQNFSKNFFSVKFDDKNKI